MDAPIMSIHVVPHTGCVHSCAFPEYHGARNLDIWNAFHYQVMHTGCKHPPEWVNPGYPPF